MKDVKGLVRGVYRAQEVTGVYLLAFAAVGLWLGRRAFLPRLGIYAAAGGAPDDRTGRAGRDRLGRRVQPGFPTLPPDQLHQRPVGARSEDGCAPDDVPPGVLLRRDDVDRRVHDPGSGGAPGRFRRAGGPGADKRSVCRGPEVGDGVGTLAASGSGTTTQHLATTMPQTMDWGAATFRRERSRWPRPSSARRSTICSTEGRKDGSPPASLTSG